MKKLFWIGLIGFLLFEVTNVYFIMPMPGSQHMNSIDVAYFLYKWRWVFRVLFGLMIIVGFLRARIKRRWLLVIPLVIVGGITYMANFVMAADHMFYQPHRLLMATSVDNRVDTQRLVIGIVNNGEAKAYPIWFLGYHHQVRDTIGGKPVMVTYCTVCRTGRVYEPVVKGKPEKFRLVGMDHFNAMFEDETTKSWWRQVSGEAVAGEMKGQKLPELFSTQTSLAKWLELNPSSLIMQLDSSFIKSYDTSLVYESGKSRSKLTGTDSLSWNDKSWVVGLKLGEERKAYDWNHLRRDRLIHDRIGSTPVIIALSSDGKGFYAFERPEENSRFILANDTLVLNNRHYRIDGKGIDTAYSLKKVAAYQEFWHSWRTFNPQTRN